jgi:hypothetical protein
MPKCYLRFAASFTALGLLLTLGAATSSRAEVGLLGWTPMVGISSGPDQLVVGAHLDFGDLVPNLHLGLYGDAGFGDDLTVVTLGPTLLFHIPLQDAGAFYAGAAGGLVYTNFDVPDVAGVDVDDTNTDFGLAGEVGYMHPVGGGHLVADLKFELSDYPDIKIMGGYRFSLTP